MSFGGGKGGNVAIQASGSVDFSGVNQSGMPSRIYTFSYSEAENAGHAGNILIQAGDVSFRDGGGIVSGTMGTGNGGKTAIYASGSVEMTGVNPHGMNAFGFGSGIYASAFGTGELSGNAGDVFIEAGAVSITDGALISSVTEGGGEGGNIFVNAKDSLHITGSSSNIELKAPLESQIAFQESGLETEYEVSSGIYSDTASPEAFAGDAGVTIISSPELRLSDKGRISASSKGAGNAGAILSEFSSLVLETGASVSSPSLHDKGGHAGTILLGGKLDQIGENSFLLSQPADKISIRDNAFVSTSSLGQGNAGGIFMSVSEMELERGASVSSASMSPDLGGDAGFIFVGKTELSEDNLSLDFHPADAIHIRDNAYITTSSIGHGDAGGIALMTRRIDLEENASIFSASLTSGDSGILYINAESLSMRENSRISTSSSGTGEAGGIALTVSKLDLDSGSSVSSSSLSQDEAGDAGDILIGSKIGIRGDASVFDLHEAVEKILRGEEVILEDDAAFFVSEPAERVQMKESSVTTEALNAGGGQIKLGADESLHLSDSKITTSVMYGEGNGGDLEIREPEFLTLNQSEIKAEAYQGQGGNIRIAADHFIRSSDSVVSASSRLGIDGSVEIDSPDTDVESGLTILPENFLDAAKWAETPCAERSGENVSRLVITGRDGVPPGIDDLLASPSMIEELKLPHDMNQGLEYYREGRFERALRSWEETIERGSGIPLEMLPLMAYAYQHIGHYRKGLALLRSRLPVVEKSDDDRSKSLFFSSLGDLCLSLGELEEAAAYLEKGIEAAHLTEDPLVLASVLNNKANLLVMRNHHSEAILAYKRSLRLMDSPGVSESSMGFSDILKTNILLNMARERENAMSALRHIRTLPASPHKARSLISLALLAFNRKETATNLCPLSLLNQAKRIAEDLNETRLASYTYGYLTRLYESEGRYPEAIQLNRSAIFFAEQNHSPEIAYLWHWQAGRLFTETGEIENAVSAYRHAIRILNPIRGELLNVRRSPQDPFNHKIRPVYLGLAELLLKQAEASEDKQSYEAKLREAIDTMELLKTAELEDFFEDECVTALEKKITRLDRSPAKTIVIYPIIFPDTLDLILTLPDGMKHITVPVNAKQLEARVRRFRKQLQIRWRYSFRSNATQLYDWLIRPIEPELTSYQTDTLIIAPDSALRLIPFAALHDGKEYLIQKYAIVTIPGVTLTDPKPLARDHLDILANGLSHARHGFSSLPNVPKELEAIRQIAKGRVLRDEEYTVENLTEEFNGHAYSVIHIASHGIFGGTAKETFLLTYNDKLTMDGLDRLISMGRFRDKPVELLTLSACQTAIGDERAALGLAGVAIKAGARSAIASLWLVDDEATYLMISEFYQQLKANHISKAEAIQRAQKKLIDQVRFRHPVYWAPFLMIGNWM